MDRDALLSDDQWGLIEPLLPPQRSGKGRPMRDHRQVVEGVIYRFRCGIAWRDLPVLPLQALNMAAFNAKGSLDELVHHADHGSNYLSVVYTDRIAELGATPSTGSVGDSYDNALAEAVNGLYKTELIRPRGPWRTVEQVELATLEYVWWWNYARLHGELDYRTPVEAEVAHYAEPESAHPALAGQGNR
jgi:putative transposase